MSNPYNQSTKMVGGVGKISDSDAELKHELSKTKAKFKRHVTEINWHNRKMINDSLRTKHTKLSRFTSSFFRPDVLRPRLRNSSLSNRTVTIALVDKMWFKCPKCGHWIFIYLSLRMLDIALVEMLGCWILGIGSLRILVIATLKTEHYSASGAKVIVCV